MPLMQLKMLVLPAPLGPMTAKNSPALTSRLTPARAATPPKLRWRSSRVRSARPDARSSTAVTPTLAGIERLFGTLVQGISAPPRLNGPSDKYAGRYAVGRALVKRRSSSETHQHGRGRAPGDACHHR